MISLKLSHKALLLIVVPLCLILIFITQLLGQLKQLEEDNLVTAKSSEAMASIHELIYDCARTMSIYFMFEASHEKDLQLWQDFKKSFSKISNDRNEIREYPSQLPSLAPQVNALVGAIDESFDMATQARQQAYVPDWKQKSVATSLYKQFMTINTTGRDLVKSIEILRKERIEAHNHSSENLRLMITSFAAGTFILAIAIAVYLGFTVNKRLDMLLTNTMNIALGKELLPPLKGNDEISQFDAALHRLSFELADARSSERALIENTAEIICSLDENFRLAQVNAAVEKILGYLPEEILGTTLASLVVESDQSATISALQECKSKNEEKTFENKLGRRDGRIINTEWAVRYSAVDRSLFCIVHDVTARKHAEKLRQEVLAMVSHDLRSPLMSVAITVDMLAEGAYGNLSEKGLLAVAKTDSSLKSLMDMINDLLELERIQYSGIVLNYEKLDIDNLILNALDMIAPQAERKGLLLNQTGEPLNINGDKDRLLRVIVNLLGNAVKFSPKQGTIDISHQLLKRSEKQFVLVEVTDHGEGIPKDRLDAVFEKFKQAGTGHAGEKAGSGLGLAICKAIVEAHQGTIGVRSTVGEGSTFWFEVPTSNL